MGQAIQLPKQKGPRTSARKSAARRAQGVPEDVPEECFGEVCGSEYPEKCAQIIRLKQLKTWCTKWTHLVGHSLFAFLIFRVVGDQKYIRRN